MKALISVGWRPSTVQWRRFSRLAPRSPPLWWQQGWARKGAGSVAEAELLAPLGELLMPGVLLGDMFRSFKGPAGWSKSYVEPDLTTYGVLKDKTAALFVEYDGYWRHAEKEGIVRDKMKNEALLTCSPPGSYVVRINHHNKCDMEETILWISINTWSRGDQKSLTRALSNVLDEMVPRLQHALVPSVHKRLEAHLRTQNPFLVSRSAQEFRETAVVTARGNTTEEILNYLKTKGFGTTCLDQMGKQVLVSGVSIEKTLEPLLHFLLDLGLSMGQVAKALGKCPRLLSYRIDQNLKPTVECLIDLGLTRSEVAKTVASFPAVLFLSIEQNLKPTMQWLLDLGLKKSEAAKAIAIFPQLLALSIDQNLKPTVQCFFDLGLTKSEVAKAVAAFPQILGYSIQQTLKPHVQWLLDFKLTKGQTAKVVASFPPILGLSIEKNLTPKVQWLLSLGLTRSQVAQAIAEFPPVLGLSSDNLSGKVKLLKSFLTPRGAAELIACSPRILSYRQQRLEHRLSVLAEQGSLAKLAGAMTRTDEVFHRSFVAQKWTNAFHSGASGVFQLRYVC